jgi:drug/metabolite transporter (DMT)-like permease
MGVLLGLLSSITYGSVDFLGGMLTRRTSVFAVALLSQLLGTVILLPVVPLFGGDPTAGAMAWGAAAGLCGGLGVTLLYRGLAIGRMSVVAPVVGVVAASVPVVAGLILGERPSAVALGGVVIALAAVGLIASAPHADMEGEPVEGPSPGAAVPVFVPPPADPGVRGRLQRAASAGLAEGLTSGVLLGFYLVFLSRTGEETGVWPVAAGRMVSVTAIALVALALRRSVKPARGTMPAIALVGTLDMAANVMYQLAVRRGLLSLIGVLSSLYPAATVVLARLVLKERFVQRQVLGLGLAAGGVVMIALG